MRRIVVLWLAVVLVLALAACSGPADAPTAIAWATRTVNEAGEASSTAVPTNAVGPAGTSSTVSVKYDSDDLDSSASSSDVATITLEGDSITFDGSGGWSG